MNSHGLRASIHLEVLATKNVYCVKGTLTTLGLGAQIGAPSFAASMLVAILGIPSSGLGLLTATDRVGDCRDNFCSIGAYNVH